MSGQLKSSKATKIVQKNIDGKPIKLIEVTEETMNPVDYRRPLDKKPVNDNSNTFDGLQYFERQQKKQNQIDEILAKGSLRERFQNLTDISTIEKMLMYAKYQELVDAFKALDESILYLKSKKAPQFMTTIKTSYPQYKSAFYKVLTVSPDSYQVEKMDNEKILQLDRSDIYIDAPIRSHLDVDGRVQKFKQDLFNYIHLNGEFIPEYQMTKSKQIVDESKKSIITQIEKTQLKSEIKLDISSEPTMSNTSKRLIEKLKQKKQLEIAETDHKAPKKQLIQVASLLHNYYLTRKVSNMFYDNVIKYASSSLKQQIMEVEKLKSYIEQLTEIGGSWISIVPNEKGAILRMDKTIDLPKIIKKIEEL